VEGKVIVPQGASHRFFKARELKLPGHANCLYTYFCASQKSMQSFDRMKSRDMYPGVWTKQSWTGRIFLGHLADAFPGKVRTVKNPVISGPGVVSGDLDHPIFSLVCNPATGIPNWSEDIWDDNSPWGQNGIVRHTRWAKDSAKTQAELRSRNQAVSLQMQNHTRFSRNWRFSKPLDVDKDVPLNDEDLLNWEKYILRHYFDWKVTNLRWECCDFLRKLIKRDHQSRVGWSSYVFQSNHPAHIILVKSMWSLSHEFHMY
jgi:hypothetical protein